MTPEEGLANAIILQAVKDYRGALRKLKKRKYDTHEDGVRRECEQFFCSQWFGELTSIDGEMLMYQLQEEVE